MPSRVALVTGELTFGGGERQITELATGLHRRGVEPVVFCLGGDPSGFGPRLEEAGVERVDIPRRNGFDLRRVVRLARHLRERRFDVVHAFLINANPYAFLASRLTNDVPFLASNRNVDLPRTSLRTKIDGIVLRRATRVVVNAEAVRKYTVERFRVPATRLAVIYNGVDVSRFHFRPSEVHKPIQVGTVGSLLEKKNPFLFGELARQSSTRNLDARFVHLGDGPLRPHLEECYGDVVQYQGSSRDVPEFLAALDLFVLTSDREGCPNVLLEAMATGLPVITTDAGGAPEIVRNGIDGLVTARGNLAQLVEAFEWLLGDADVRSRFGRSARTRVETCFDTERMVETTLQLYREVLAGDPGNYGKSFA